MDLTVVVPCFNEAEVIDRFADELCGHLTELGREYEVILVDDGSADESLERMRAIHEKLPRFRYLALSRNFGKESAMLAGLAQARGKAVALMDADLQHPPELLRPMLALIDAGFEQVVARRDRSGDPWLRTVASKAYYRFVNRLIDVELRDGAGDFRVFDQKVVSALLSLGETNRFSKGLFAWVGFHTTYINYRNAPRAAGESKWGFRSLFNYSIDSVISFNDKPLRVAIHTGVLISLVAVAYGAWVVADAILHGNGVPGYVTLICAVVGLGGLQMVMLGIIGEYLGRIYTEAKARPHFFVREASELSPLRTPIIGRGHDRSLSQEPALADSDDAAP
jgi:polyisoprenyl-phosphate glycosyltransferase